jgi:hypothetical protein
MNNILIGTNVYGKYKRQDFCIESIKRLKAKNSNIDICLVQEPIDKVEYENIQVFSNLTRNSSVIEEGRTLPFITDIFDVLAEHSKDWFVFCNSDIILTQDLIDHIINNDIEAQGISRIEIPEINKLSDSLQPIRMEPAGFDCWVVKKKWWKSYRYLFQDFLLGRPFFDVHLTMLMFLYSKDIHVSSKHLIYHIQHPSNGFVRDAYYKFNEQQAEKFYKQTESIWGEISNTTFLARKDFGRFFEIGEAELQIINDIKTSYPKVI